MSIDRETVGTMYAAAQILGDTETNLGIFSLGYCLAYQFLTDTAIPPKQEPSGLLAGSFALEEGLREATRMAEIRQQNDTFRIMRESYLQLLETMRERAKQDGVVDEHGNWLEEKLEKP